VVAYKPLVDGALDIVSGEGKGITPHGGTPPTFVFRRPPPPHPLNGVPTASSSGRCYNFEVVLRISSLRTEVR